MKPDTRSVVRMDALLDPGKVVTATVARSQHCVL